ncbi:MAG: hypothetical protein V3T70_10935 [Phycisphaerae bacterium]
MRFRAELAPGVLRDMQRSYSQEDVADFFRELDRVCDAPLKQSQIYFDPEFSRYAYRWFPFGVGVEKVAVFHFDGRVVRVLTCRLSRPPRPRNPANGG